jgi:hypothetical protein
LDMMHLLDLGGAGLAERVENENGPSAEGPPSAFPTRPGGAALTSPGAPSAEKVAGGGWRTHFLELPRATLFKRAETVQAANPPRRGFGKTVRYAEPEGPLRADVRARRPATASLGHRRADREKEPGAPTDREAGTLRRSPHPTSSKLWPPSAGAIGPGPWGCRPGPEAAPLRGPSTTVYGPTAWCGRAS